MQMRLFLFLVAQTFLISNISFADTPNCTSHGDTPNKILLDAAYKGDVACVKIALEQNANILTQDSKLNSALHLAISWGYSTYEQHEIVKALILKAAEVNKLDDLLGLANDSGDTALHKATDRVGDENIADLLINNGADIVAKNKNGATPLHSACNLKVVKKLVAHAKQSTIVNYMTMPDKNKNTPLHHAVMSYECADVVQYYLDSNADLLAKNLWGYMPIHYAHQVGIIQKLLAKANALGLKDYINSKNDKDETPLFTSAGQVNNELAIAYYINNGARLDIMSKDWNIRMSPYNIEYGGWTVLHRAAKYGVVQNLKQIVTMATQKGHGDILLQKTEADDTALHIAVAAGNLDATKYLIQEYKKAGHPEFIDAIDHFGLTALMITAINDDPTITNQLEMAKLLIAEGAKVNTGTNTKYGTVLHRYIDRYGFRPKGNDYLTFLLDSGADIFSHDMYNETPLMIAITNGDLDIYNILMERAEKQKPKDYSYLVETNTWSDTLLHTLSKPSSVRIVDSSRTTCSAPYRAAAILAIASDLLKKGLTTEINKQNTHGTTALSAAVESCHYDLAVLYIAAGAEKAINSERTAGDYKGLTALQIAILLNSEPLVNLLIENGADITQTVSLGDYEGQNALHMAYYSPTLIIKLLEAAKTHKIVDYAKSLVLAGKHKGQNILDLLQGSIEYDMALIKKYRQRLNHYKEEDLPESYPGQFEGLESNIKTLEARIQQTQASIEYVTQLF